MEVNTKSVLVALYDVHWYSLSFAINWRLRMQTHTVHCDREAPQVYTSMPTSDEANDASQEGEALPASQGATPSAQSTNKGHTSLHTNAANHYAYKTQLYNLNSSIKHITNVHVADDA